jgi:hypothetical protein
MTILQLLWNIFEYLHPILNIETLQVMESIPKKRFDNSNDCDSFAIFQRYTKYNFKKCPLTWLAPSTMFSIFDYVFTQ